MYANLHLSQAHKKGHIETNKQKEELREQHGVVACSQVTHPSLLRVPASARRPCPPCHRLKVTEVKLLLFFLLQSQARLSNLRVVWLGAGTCPPQSDMGNDSPSEVRCGRLGAPGC